jgi:predicted acyltransferase (DUF342 family)
MLFKVTSKDNKGNSLFIQGSYSRNTTNDVSSITFQNYDDDSKGTYNIARISARDAFGSSDLNGYGDMLLFTNGDGSNLSERMRIKSDGNVCIGTLSSINNSLLSVNGSTTIATNLNVGNNVTAANVIVSSNVSLSNDLLVMKNAVINGNIVATSNLYVYDDVDIFGAANIRNRLTVHGGLMIKRNSNVTTSNDSSEITLSNDLRILEDGVIQGTLEVSSNVTFSNTFQVLGDVILRSNLNVYQALTIGGNAVFNSASTFSGPVIFSQSFDVSNNITINGNATVHSALIVNSNAIIGKDAILAGNLTTMSNVTLGASVSSNVITFNGRTSINANHSNPSLVINQTGTGNILTIQKNGVPKIVASSNGYLGIGTSNPSKILEVIGDVNFVGDIYQNNSIIQKTPVPISFSPIKNASKSYRSMLSWINNAKIINNMYVNSFLTAQTTGSNSYYKIRIYDSTNNITLHTSTHSNQTPSNLFLTLTNVSSNQIISMELHGHVGPSGNYMCVGNTLLNYS